MPKEVELIPRGDRGFVSFGAPIETDAAPQVLSDGRVSMSAHISIEDAKELRRRLKAFIERAEEKGFDPYDGDGN